MVIFNLEPNWLITIWATAASSYCTSTPPDNKAWAASGALGYSLTTRGLRLFGKQYSCETLFIVCIQAAPFIEEIVLPHKSSNLCGKNLSLPRTTSTPPVCK